jgi:hypothetical protein
VYSPMSLLKKARRPGCRPRHLDNKHWIYSTRRLLLRKYSISGAEVLSYRGYGMIAAC